MSQSNQNPTEEPIIHIEEDKSFKSDDKFIPILDDKNPTNDEKLLNIEERISSENMKAEKLLSAQNLKSEDDFNNMGLLHMEIESEPKKENEKEIEKKEESNDIINKANDNNIDINYKNIEELPIEQSHILVQKEENLNENIVDINNNDINNIDNKNDNLDNNNNVLTNENIPKEELKPKNEEEEKEKEKTSDKNNDIKISINGTNTSTSDEMKALLSSNNKEQLNDLIELLVHDKDFMKEFLQIEKKNSTKDMVPGDEEKKEEEKINSELEGGDKNNILSNKDFENIYKELHEDGSKGKKQLNGNFLNDFDDDILLDEDEEKNDNTPYNKIYRLIKKNGINRIFNMLIDIFNKTDTKFRFLEEEEIKEEVVEITKTIRKDVLFIYLMKIISNNTVPPIFPSGQNLTKNNMSQSTITPELSRKDLFPNVTKYEKPVTLTKKKTTANNNTNNINIDQYQYHSRHFHWKHGKLYSYAPKNKIRSNKCYLYCSKSGCDAKVQIDMSKKRATFIGSHNEHEGIDIEKYAYEYPGLDSNKDWKHMQYDSINGKKVMMWKY